MVELCLNPGCLISKPMWLALESGREETSPYTDILCLPGAIQPKERNWKIKLAISLNAYRAWLLLVLAMAPRNTSTLSRAQLNYPGIGTNLPHFPKGKAILPDLPWDLYAVMSPVSHMVTLCFTCCYSLGSTCYLIFFTLWGRCSLS